MAEEWRQWFRPITAALPIADQNISRSLPATRHDKTPRAKVACQNKVDGLETAVLDNLP
ncbi:hypothetical protein N9L68_01525 [bacterium]|nr:hypothetical protein [bacterium]